MDAGVQTDPDNGGGGGGGGGGGADLTLTFTEISKSWRSFSEWEVTRIRQLSDQIGERLEETSHSEVAVVGAEGFPASMGAWKVDEQIKQMAGKMLLLQRTKSTAINSFSYRDAGSRMSYCIIMGHNDGDKIHLAHGTYKCAASLLKYEDKYALVSLVRGGEHDGEAETAIVALTSDQRSFLEDTYCPHRVLASMEEKGIIDQISYR